MGDGYIAAKASFVLTKRKRTDDPRFEVSKAPAFAPIARAPSPPMTPVAPTPARHSIAFSSSTALPTATPQQARPLPWLSGGDTAPRHTPPPAVMTGSLLSTQQLRPPPKEVLVQSGVSGPSPMGKPQLAFSMPRHISGENAHRSFSPVPLPVQSAAVGRADQHAGIHFALTSAALSPSAHPIPPDASPMNTPAQSKSAAVGGFQLLRDSVPVVVRSVSPRDNFQHFRQTHQHAVWYSLARVRCGAEACADSRDVRQGIRAGSNRTRGLS